MQTCTLHWTLKIDQCCYLFEPESLLGKENSGSSPYQKKNSSLQFCIPNELQIR